MDLSIIIPCYNEYNNLKQLLPFILKESNSKIELIVADASHSSDETETLCLQYNIKYHKCTVTQRAGQMNQGAELAKGHTLFFLHADVLPPENYFSEIQNALSDNSGFGLFPYKFETQNLLLKINASFTKYKGLFCGGGDQGHFATRDIFDKLGGYNTSFDIMEDFEFYDRIKSHGIKIHLGKSKALASARKYENNSYLRVNLTNLIAFIMYKMKIPSTRIKKFCKRWLKG